MEKVHQVVHVNRLCRIQKVCNILGISYMTCQCLLTKNLNMRKTATKFVPCPLNDKQKQNQLSVCKDWQYQAMNDRNFSVTSSRSQR